MECVQREVDQCYHVINMSASNRILGIFIWMSCNIQYALSIPTRRTPCKLIYYQFPDASNVSDLSCKTFCSTFGRSASAFNGSRFELRIRLGLRRVLSTTTKNELSTLNEYIFVFMCVIGKWLRGFFCHRFAQANIITMAFLPVTTWKTHFGMRYPSGDRSFRRHCTSSTCRKCHTFFISNHEKSRQPNPFKFGKKYNEN